MNLTDESVYCPVCNQFVDIAEDCRPCDGVADKGASFICGIDEVDEGYEELDFERVAKKFDLI